MAVTDLTGTKWEFVGENVGSSVINFPKGETQTEDSLPSTSDFNSTKGYNLVLSATDLLTNTDFVNETGYLIAVWDNDIGDNIGIYFGNASHIYKVAGENDSHVSYNIEITGGTDATNSDLIAWLQSNATQIQDEPSNTLSFGNLPIANMYFGTRQVKKVYLGNALVWEKEETANLISFTIDSTTYQAESGMTWGEWVASSYNTGGYYVSGSRCLSSAGGVVHYDAQTEVKTGIEIVANHIYIAVISPGGGGGSDN